DTTVPSARTASIPRNCARIGPKRRTRSPPALVATAPPTVALPRLAIRIPQIQARVGVRRLLKGDPGPGRDLRCLTIDRSHPVQAGQAQHDLTVQGHAPADQAGVS